MASDDQPATSRDIVVRSVAASPTAVVARSTTWDEFPDLWPRLLDQVYVVIGARGMSRHGHNVVLYHDDVPNVEVGVQVSGPFAAEGDVVPSALPAGLVATTIHRGPYATLVAAHHAVRTWCAQHGRHVTGVRWEIYGDWNDDPAALATEINYLIG